MDKADYEKTRNVLRDILYAPVEKQIDQQDFKKAIEISLCLCEEKLSHYVTMKLDIEK